MRYLILALVFLVGCHAPAPTTPEGALNAGELPECPAGWRFHKVAPGLFEHRCLQPTLDPAFIGHEMSVVEQGGGYIYVRTEASALTTEAALATVERLLGRYHTDQACRPISDPEKMVADGLGLLCDGYMVIVEPNPREKKISVLVSKPETWP